MLPDPNTMMDFSVEVLFLSRLSTILPDRRCRCSKSTTLLIVFKFEMAFVVWTSLKHKETTEKYL
jgi:hypothetical protein